MRSTLFILCLLCGFSLSAQVLLRWEVDTARSAPKILEVYQGETVNFEVSLRESGAVKVFPSTATAVFLWQTNGMGSAWWSQPAVVSGSVVRATWSPSNDVGNASYTWYVAVIDSATVNYRVNGTLRIRDSPGFSPAALASPSLNAAFAAAVIAVVGTNSVVSGDPVTPPVPTRLYNVWQDNTGAIYTYSVAQRAYIRQPAKDLALWRNWTTTNGLYTIDGTTNQVVLASPAQRHVVSPVVNGVVQKDYHTYEAWTESGATNVVLTGSAGTIQLIKLGVYDVP